uniref:Phospholipid scramblase n=1 Tax=Alexandrium monilatum TaxID=311494 RepID=A0A7S4VAT8_9DINO|mmetsp:Transcript_177/g.606  ORF Transcript_177/g.606 Transcript_177/m.606 type:complete len:227 (+) Transcript_177:101-781(+)
MPHRLVAAVLLPCLVGAVRRQLAAEVHHPYTSALVLYSPTNAASSGAASVASLPELDRGGTTCQCICGDRVIWQRELFAGDVKEIKEKECESDICPYVSIPGLQVVSQCTYVKDIRELTSGTACFCQCGDKAAWVNRAFYGNVTEEKERECIEVVCPRVNPLPGLILKADCHFDSKLFTLHRSVPPLSPGAPVTRNAAIWALGSASPACSLLAVLAACVAATRVKP